MDPSRRLAAFVAALPVLLLLIACGDEPAPAPEVPLGANVEPERIAEAEEHGGPVVIESDHGVEILPGLTVAPEQIAEAKKHDVPVAFENELGMWFVLIPSGTFWMGSPEDEEGRGEDEPLHEVTITTPFYMSIHEVTNGQYRAWKGYHDSGSLERLAVSGGVYSALDDDRQPVVYVSWTDAFGFAKWLSVQDAARVYRLPTEAEWEHACRAGTETPFCWGDGITTAHANYDGDFTYAGGVVGENRMGSTQVGKFQPNSWALFDLHGNVCEWCADWYAPYPAGPAQDPRGPPYGEAPAVTAWLRYGEDVRSTHSKARVRRGGSWNLLPQVCRSASRQRGAGGDRDDYIGFRIVTPLSDPGE